MDKTPIRIRGKRASARALHSGPKGKRPLSPTSRSSSPAAKLPRQNPYPPQRTTWIRSLSYLERLPVELLEAIFFYSLNPGLPQASIALGQKLSSTRVKSQLVLRTLSSPNSFDYPCAVSDIFPTLQEQARAQSAILRLPWMTLPFFRQLVPDYIVHTIIRELGARRLRWMGEGPIVTKESEPLIRKFLEDNAARFGHPGMKQCGLPAYWETKWHESSTQQDIILGIGLGDGLVTFRECETISTNTNVFPRFTYAYAYPHFSKWRLFNGIEGCQIPPTLLRGPWTSSKCEFLELLIRGNASVDRLNTTAGEVAELGFLEAISEHNARAVRALVARIGPCGTRPNDAECTSYPTTRPSCKRSNDETFLETVLGYRDSIYREDPVRKGVGIVPRQEHLRKVLEESEEGKVDMLDALLGAAEVGFELWGEDTRELVMGREDLMEGLGFCGRS